MADACQQTIKAVCEDPRTGFGSIDFNLEVGESARQNHHTSGSSFVHQRLKSST